MATETVTILRSVDDPPVVLAKHNRYLSDGKWVTEPTLNGSFFFARSEPVSGIRKLSELLVSLASRRDLCIIRGEPSQIWTETDPAVRRRKEYFPERARRWVLLDIEKYAAPAGLDLFRDYRAIAAQFVERLPAEFQGVSHHVQLSGNAGKNPNEFRAHFWFWLTNPAGHDDLDRCLGKNSQASAREYIDPAVFRTVQINITADPVFENGPDPFEGCRSWFVEGTHDEVELVLPDAPLIGSETVPRAVAAPIGVGGFLEQMGDGPGLLGFHDAIVKSCASLFSGGPNISLSDRTAWKDKVRGAIKCAPGATMRAGDDLERYGSNVFLDGLLASYERKERGKIMRVVGTPAPGTEEYPPELPPMVAKERLQTGIAVWIGRALARVDGAPAEQLLIKGAAGLGKTTSAIDALAALPNLAALNIEFYAPTRELGIELTEKLRIVMAGRTPVDMIHGRGAVVDGQPMCQRAPLAQAAAEAGWDVTKHVCEGVRSGEPNQPCPHRFECPYIAQFGYQGPQVRVLTHAHLRTRHRMRLPPADLTIVDESFHKEGYRTDMLPLAELRLPHSILPNERAVDDLCSLIADTLEKRLPLLGSLRDAGHTAESVRKLTGLVFENERQFPSFDADEQAVDIIKKNERPACTPSEPMRQNWGFS